MEKVFFFLKDGNGIMEPFFFPFLKIIQAYIGITF